MKLFKCVMTDLIIGGTTLVLSPYSFAKALTAKQQQSVNSFLKNWPNAKADIDVLLNLYKTGDNSPSYRYALRQHPMYFYHLHSIGIYMGIIPNSLKDYTSRYPDSINQTIAEMKKRASATKVLAEIQEAAKQKIDKNIKATASTRNLIQSFLYNQQLLKIDTTERSNIYNLINTKQISAQNAYQALSTLFRRTNGSDTAPTLYADTPQSEIENELNNYIFYLNSGITSNANYQEYFNNYTKSKVFIADLNNYFKANPTAISAIVDKFSYLNDSAITNSQKEKIAYFLLNHPSYQNQIKTLLVLAADKGHSQQLLSNLQSQQISDLKTFSNYFGLAPESLNSVTTINTSLKQNLEQGTLAPSSTTVISQYQTAYINSLAISAGLTTLPKGYLQVEAVEDNISNLQLEQALTFLKQSNDGGALQLKTVALIELHPKKATKIFSTLSDLQLLQSDYAPKLMAAYHNNSPIIRGYLNKHDAILVKEALIKYPSLRYMGINPERKSATNYSKSSLEFASQQRKMARFLLANPQLEPLVRIALKAHLLNTSFNIRWTPFSFMSKAKQEAYKKKIAPSLLNIKDNNPELMAYIVGLLQHFGMHASRLPVTAESKQFEKQLAKCSIDTVCKAININKINDSLSPVDEYKVTVGAIQYAFPLMSPPGIKESVYKSTLKSIGSKLVKLEKTATPDQLSSITAALGYLMRSMLTNQSGSGFGNSFQQKSYDFELYHPKVFDGYFKILTGLGLQNFLKGAWGTRYGIENLYLKSHQAVVSKIIKTHEKLFVTLKLSNVQQQQIGAYIALNPKMENVIITNLKVYQSIIPLYTSSIRLVYSKKWPRYMQRPNLYQVTKNIYNAPTALKTLGLVFPNLVSDTLTTMHRFGISPIDQTKLNGIGFFRNQLMYGDVVQKTYLSLSPYIPQVTQLLRNYITIDMPKFEIQLAANTIKSIINYKNFSKTTKTEFLTQLGNNPYYSLTINAAIAYHQKFKDNKSGAASFAKKYPKVTLILEKALQSPQSIKDTFVTNISALKALGAYPKEAAAQDALMVISKVNKLKILTNSKKQIITNAIFNNPPYNVMLQTSLNTVFYSKELTPTLKNTIIKVIANQITKDGVFRTSTHLDVKDFSPSRLAQYLGVSSKILSNATIALQEMGHANSKLLHMLYTSYPDNTSFAQAITALNSLPMSANDKSAVLSKMESYITFNPHSNSISIKYAKNDLSNSLSLIYDSINYLKLFYNKNDKGHKNLLIFTAQHPKQTGDILRQLNSINNSSGTSIFTASGLQAFTNNSKYSIKGKDKTYTAPQLYKYPNYQAGFDKPSKWDEFKDAMKGIGEMFISPFKKHDGSIWHRIKGLLNIAALAVAPIDPAGDAAEAIEMTDEMTDAASLVEEANDMSDTVDVAGDIDDADDATDSDNLMDKANSKIKKVSRLIGKAESIKDDGNTAGADGDSKLKKSQNYWRSFYEMLSDVHQQIEDGEVSKSDLKVLHKGSSMDRLAKGMQLTGRALSKDDDALEFVKVFETERESFLKKLGGSLEALKDTDGEDSDGYHDAVDKLNSLDRKVRFAKAMEIIGETSDIKESESFVSMDQSYTEALTGNTGGNTTIGHLPTNIIFAEDLMGLDKDSDVEAEKTLTEEIAGDQPAEQPKVKGVTLNERKTQVADALEKVDSASPITDEELSQIKTFFTEFRETKMPEIPDKPEIGAEGPSKEAFEELYDYEQKLYIAGNYLRDIANNGLEHQERWDSYISDSLEHLKEYELKYNELKSALSEEFGTDDQLGTSDFKAYIKDYEGVSAEFKKSLEKDIYQYQRRVQANILTQSRDPFAKFEDSDDLTEEERELVSNIKTQLEYKRDLFEAYSSLFKQKASTPDSHLFDPSMLKSRIIICSKINDYNEIEEELFSDLNTKTRISNIKDNKERPKDLESSITDYKKSQALISRLEIGESELRDSQAIPSDDLSVAARRLESSIQEFKRTSNSMITHIKVLISSGDMVDDDESVDWILNELKPKLELKSEYYSTRIDEEQAVVNRAKAKVLEIQEHAQDQLDNVSVLKAQTASLQANIADTEKDIEADQKLLESYKQKTVKIRLYTKGRTVVRPRLKILKTQLVDMQTELYETEGELSKAEENTTYQEAVSQLEKENGDIEGARSTIKSTSKDFNDNQHVLAKIEELKASVDQPIDLHEPSINSPVTTVLPVETASETENDGVTVFEVSQLDQRYKALIKAQSDFNDYMDKLTKEQDVMEKRLQTLSDLKKSAQTKRKSIDDEFGRNEQSKVVLFRGMKQSSLAKAYNKQLTVIEEYDKELASESLKEAELNSEGFFPVRHMSGDLKVDISATKEALEKAKQSLSIAKTTLKSEVLTPDWIKTTFHDYDEVITQGTSIVEQAPEDTVADDRSFIENASKAYLMRNELEQQKQALQAEFDHARDVDHHRSLESQLQIINANIEDVNSYVSGLVDIAEDQNSGAREVIQRLTSRQQQLENTTKAYIKLLEDQSSEAAGLSKAMLEDRIGTLQDYTQGTTTELSPLMKAQILSSSLPDVDKAPLFMDSYSDMQSELNSHISELEKSLSDESSETALVAQTQLELEHLKQVQTTISQLQNGRDLSYVRSVAPYVKLNDLAQLARSVSSASAYDVDTLKTEVSAFSSKLEHAQDQLNIVLQNKLYELKSAESRLREAFPGELSKNISIPHVDDLEKFVSTSILKTDKLNTEDTISELSQLSNSALHESQLKAIQKFKTVFAETNALKKYESLIERMNQRATALIDSSSLEKNGNIKVRLNLFSKLNRAVTHYYLDFIEGSKIIIKTHKFKLHQPFTNLDDSQNNSNQANKRKATNKHAKPNTHTASPQDIRSGQPMNSSSAEDSAAEDE